MSVQPTGDRRRPLRLSRVTWDRHDLAARRNLAREAAILGYRIIIVTDDGLEHETTDDLDAK